MWLVSLVFPLLTPIISSPCFIYPFFVSLNPFSLYLYHHCWFSCCSGVAVDLLEANYPLDESIDSSTMSSLRFCYTESTGDTEADISPCGRGATSPNEEIHKEERSWIFIPLDDIGCMILTIVYLTRLQILSILFLCCISTYSYFWILFWHRPH